MSSLTKGNEFENQVAELYRLMGYEVNKNVGVLGHQIDMILSYKMPGGIETKTAVECKYVKEGNLKKNDVQSNIYALADLKRHEEVQHLVIVTTNGFAKDIWDTAKANKIELLTLRQLQHQIVDFDQYLDSLIKGFDEDELNKYYVDLIAQDDEKVPNEIFDPVDAYVTEWINDSKKNHLSILGEYGTGKTTFCRKFAHDLALQYKKDPLDNRIPILINLRDCFKTMNIQRIITDLFIDKYGLKGIDFPLFERMNDEGLFLLILDGFDEMAQKVIFDVAYFNFSKIAELARAKKSKVILTCRTEFFRTHEQEKEILFDIDKRENFALIYLKEFNDKQIKEYLQKRVPLVETQKKKQGWEYYYQKIYDVFDLRDLAKRPVLLELIVKYLPRLIEKGEKIDASTLYLTAIQEELKRRIKVGKMIITKNDRVKLMKLLAAWMYNHDKWSLYFEDLPELLNLKIHFDLKARTDIEYHLNDFLTCSFLNRDTEGNYRFSHKSFADFLVAWKFIEDIENDSKDDFMQKRIAYEVIQFMKDFEFDRNKMYEWIETTKNKSFSETQYLGGNAVSVLNELGENFANRGFDFSETVLDYANLSEKDLQGLNFQNSKLRYANLNGANLVNVNFSFADLEGAALGKMEGIRSICWSPDGKYLAGGGSSGTLKIWDGKNFKELASIKGHTREVDGLAYTNDGKYLASGSWDGKIKIWDMETFEEITTLEGHTEYVCTVDCSPDGKYLASGDNEDIIKIWDMETYEEIATLNGQMITVDSVVFSPDGKCLAGGGFSGKIKIWDMETYEEIATFKRHWIMRIAFSPDGKYLACGCHSPSVYVWDMETFEEIATLDFQNCCVRGIAYSPDGKYFAVGGEEIRLFKKEHGKIRIWDMETFEEIATLEGHPSLVFDVTYSPDGKYLASGSKDETVRIWNVNPRSEKFSKCQRILKQQINCKGMYIKGVKGLDKGEIKFLKKRGAIDK